MVLTGLESSSDDQIIVMGGAGTRAVVPPARRPRGLLRLDPATQGPASAVTGIAPPFRRGIPFHHRNERPAAHRQTVGQPRWAPYVGATPAYTFITIGVDGALYRWEDGASRDEEKSTAQTWCERLAARIAGVSLEAQRVLLAIRLRDAAAAARSAARRGRGLRLRCTATALRGSAEVGPTLGQRHLAVQQGWRCLQGRRFCESA